MGCWNGTDGFGGMPITAGQKTKVIIIQNNINLPEASGFCYLNGYATPISFVIEGEYNDYGTIDSIDTNSLSVDLFLKLVNKELKEGKIKVMAEDAYNKSVQTEKSCISSINDIEELLELIERDRVFRQREKFPSKEIVYTNIGLMLFSEEIYQSILSKNKMENLEKDISYFTEDVLTSSKIDEKSQRILDSLEEREDKDEGILEMIKEIKEKGTLFQNHWKQKSRSVDDYYNYVAHLNSYNSVEVDVFRDYFELIKFNDFDSTKIEKTLFDLISVISFMTSLRRSWSARTGKGGQDFESPIFMAFAKGVLEQSMKKYLELKGTPVYCYNNYLKFKKGKEYDVIDVRTDTIVFSIDGEYYDITFSEFDSCLEN